MATRRESVRLSYHSNIAAGAGRDAAAIALLNQELERLDGHATRLGRGLGDLGSRTDTLSRQLNRSGSDINRYSGRLRLLAEAVAVLGPGALPIGAVAIPAVAGLAAQLAFAAAAGGTAILAFQGVGDALTTMREASLEPTVANLEAAQVAMQNLSPAARGFVRELRSMADTGKSLRIAASEGIFPGLTDALDIIDSRGPQVERILFKIGETVGDLAARGAASLDGSDWDDFFDFIENEARPSLIALGTSIGNTVHALGQLWMAFGPLNNDFNSWMVDATRSLDRWATGLSKTEGFADFVDYIRTAGPQVADTMAAVGRALVDIAQAAAPLGGPVLEALEAIAKTISFIASSDVGTELVAMAAAGSLIARLAKPIRATSAALTGLGVSAASARAGLMSLNTVQFAGILAGIYGISTAFEKLEDNDIGDSDLTRGLEALSNGNWTGNLEDVGTHLVNINAAMAGVNDVMSDVFTFGLDKSGLEDAEDFIDQLDNALASLVEGGEVEQAAAAFDQIVAKGREAGVSTEDITKQFTQYGLALENLGPATDGASSAMSAWAANQQAAARMAAATKAEILGLVAAMEEQRQAALAAFDAETQWAVALKSARAQAAKNSAGIRGNSEAALENRTQLSGLAAAWNNQSDAVRNNIGRFQAARRAFIDTAVAMGVPRAAARNLAKALMEIPRSVVVKINANADPALRAIAAIKAQLASVPRSIRTDYYVNQINSISRNQAALDAQPRAAGGPVFGPGTETSDSILVRMSNNEHVWTAREVRNAGGHGAMLAMRSMYQFANGGSPDLEAHPVGPSGGKRMPPRLPGRQPASALSGMTHQINLAGLSLKQLNRRLGQSESALEKEKNQRERLVGRRNELAGSVSDKFRTDIFGERPEGFEWMSKRDQKSAMGNWKTTLRTDIANARKFTQLLKKLKAKGLNGGALAELAQTGDVARAELFASMSRRELNEYERLFNMRERVAGTAGSTAGNAVFGAAIDKQTRELQQVRRELQQIKGAIKGGGKKLGKDIGHEAGTLVAHAVSSAGHRQLTAAAAGAQRNRGGPR